MTTPIEPNPQRWSQSSDPASIVIPGLDTDAPINDQIDQIEQLITIKLQNVDANLSRIQHLMATRLLPAVKRYALGTEPVREAAKFWTSFYEQAAQVHIPTLDDDDDDDAVSDEQTQSSAAASEPALVSRSGGDVDVTPTRTPSEMRTYDVTASESSFMPSNAVSSTPARPGHAPDRTVDDQPSWSASLESPIIRLKSELQRFAREEETSAREEDTASFTEDSIMYEEENTIQQPPQIGQGKTERNASRSDDDGKVNVQSSRIPRSALPTPRANASNAYVSPLKVKPKTPIVVPKHIQTFLPTKLENEPPFPSPRRPRYERTPRKPTATTSSASTSASASSSVLDIPSLTRHCSASSQEGERPAFNDSFDDSIDLMQGMSPPRTLAFARAPRSSVGLGILPPLGQTPGKSMLPSLGRTPGKEAADRIRRDLLGDMQSHLGSTSSATSNKMRTPAFGYGAAGAAKDDTMSTIPTPPSLSRYMRNAHPSWTGSSDSAQVPEASDGDGDGFDDSFDSEDGYDVSQDEDLSVVTEETVFGIPPAPHRQQSKKPGQLKLLGEDLLQDTIGIGGQLAKAGRIEESPTPYGRG